jgi:phospholipid-translocating ATPase
MSSFDIRLSFRLTDGLENDYELWSKCYHDATIAMEKREEQIEAVSNEIEQDLRLLGATAIEDKLQDGVPETIADLKRAGIKIWVATGDKLETAIGMLLSPYKKSESLI